MNLFAKFRFLPATIFFISLMLTIKIGDIWNSVDGMISGAIRVADAVAQTQDEATTQPAAADPSDTGQVPTPAPAPIAVSPDDISATTSKLIADDPTFLTPVEIDLLQQLRERREVLESREQELTMRTGLLQAAEARIDRKVEELKGLRETISGLIQTIDEQQEAKLLSLVKIYEAMKPKDAARIFQELELNTLLEVAERMKERKLAAIMSKMNSEKAREVTVELRNLRELPKIGVQTGG